MNTFNDSTSQEVITIIKQFLTELEAKRQLATLTPSSELDRDLGIDSLGRVELFQRIQNHFAIRFTTQAMGDINTVQQLIDAVHVARPETALQQTSHQVSTLEPSKVDPSQADSLVAVLRLYAEKEPDRPHIYLVQDDGSEMIITYGQLYQQAQATAAGLQKQGLRAKETVAIMLPTSAEFFYAFFGTLLAGGIPVPIYPPFRPNRISEYALRESAILKNAEARILITFTQAESLSRLLKVFILSLKAVTTVADLQKSQTKGAPYQPSTTDAALIQYTSGSTSLPKGVLLSHANLLANIRAYGQAIGVQPNDRMVSWLPLYHDMGLIGAWLGSFYYGVPVTIMSPLFFLTNPEVWLWYLHYHGATISAGPNFAYELCVKKIQDRRLEGLNLSTLRLLFNGAEAVNPNTIRNFTKRFSAYGLREDAFHPVYGLAESAVALTFPPGQRKPIIDRIQRDAFEKQRQAIPAKDDDVHDIEFVACGEALPGHEIRVVDAQQNLLSDRHIGFLQFKGPSTMQGYYRNPEATAAVKHGDWVDTGDLAYIADGDVYIVGRNKDLIIKAGRNYYPEEIEEITTQIEGVRKGCVAAFGIHDPETGTEKLVVVAETAVQSKEHRAEIEAAIVDKLTVALGTPPDQIVLAKPRSIPKTSSGKLRRSSAREEFLSGQLQKSGAPRWLQYCQLLTIGAIKKVGRFFTKTAKAIYTGYLAIIALIFIVPLWLGVRLLSQRNARRYVRKMARFSFRLAACPIKISGQKYLDQTTPAIFVANHTSYIDAILLTAILPSNTIFIGKKELQKSSLINSFVKKLGYILVERWDFSQSIADAKQIDQAIHDGNSVAMFPEGTFTYATGVRPFKTGAFDVAVKTNTPVVALAIQGARTILRADSWLFAPGKITVTVHPPIKPVTQEWKEVARLKTHSRDLIARDCGEGILDV